MKLEGKYVRSTVARGWKDELCMRVIHNNSALIIKISVISVPSAPYAHGTNSNLKQFTYFSSVRVYYFNTSLQYALYSHPCLPDGSVHPFAAGICR